MSGKLDFFRNAFFLFPFDDSYDYIGELTKYRNICIFLETCLDISPESCETQYDEKRRISYQNSIEDSQSDEEPLEEVESEVLIPVETVEHDCIDNWEIEER